MPLINKKPGTSEQPKCPGWLAERNGDLNCSRRFDELDSWMTVGLEIALLVESEARPSGRFEMSVRASSRMDERSISSSVMTGLGKRKQELHLTFPGVTATAHAL